MKAHFLEPDDRLHRFRNSSEKKLFYTDPRGVGTVESVEANYEFLLGWYATVLGDGELPSFGVMKARIESKLIACKPTVHGIYHYAVSIHVFIHQETYQYM